MPEIYVPNKFATLSLSAQYQGTKSQQIEFFLTTS